MFIAHPRYGSATMQLIRDRADGLQLKWNANHWTEGEAAGANRQLDVSKETAEALCAIVKPLWQNPFLLGSDDRIDFTGASFLLRMELKESQQRATEAYSGTCAGRICERLYAAVSAQFELVEA
jgi:hypothetical protein